MIVKSPRSSKAAQIARRLKWRLNVKTNIPVPGTDSEKARGVMPGGYFKAEDMHVWWGRPQKGQNHVLIMLAIRYRGQKDSEVDRILADRTAALKKHFEKIEHNNAGSSHFEFSLPKGVDQFKMVIEKCHLIFRQFGIKPPDDHRLPEVEEYSFIRIGKELVIAKDYMQSLYKELSR